MAEEVEAEVIEDDELAVTYVPATITANFDELERRVRDAVSLYEGATYDLADPSAVRDAKRHRAYLNGIAKQIDERRKAVKREYSRPLDAFDARAREVASIATKASDAIKAQLDEAEERRRADAYADLSEHYEGYAGLLAPVVPYERLHEDRWLNKTCPRPKAYEELDSKVAKVAEDWQTVKDLYGGTDRLELAERAFFHALDLAQAMRAVREAEEADARIAELRQATEPVVAGDASEEAREWVVELTATRSQMKALAAQLHALGLSGRIRRKG